MKILKKTFSILVIAGFLSAPMSLVSRDSQAALILGAWDNQFTGGEAVLVVIACIITLPLCILDQEVAPSNQFLDTEYLFQNGYSTDQAMTILKDQANLVRVLSDTHQKLSFQADETKQTLSESIRSLVPGVSETYLDFISEYSGFAPGKN